MAESFHLENTEKHRKFESDGDLNWVAGSDGGLWQYGWTHYGTSGQTPARLQPHTHEVEIKDGNEWIRCAAGADAFFTRDLQLA
jgi:hypothetical protein